MLPAISHLNHNLRQIHSAVQVEGRTPLTTNARGDCLYDSSKGILGRLWDLITYIFCCCVAGYRELRLRAALHKTMQLFLVNKVKIEQLAKDYEQQISNACNNQPYDRTLTPAKHAISTWRSSTGPFFDLWNSSRKEKVQQLFQHYGSYPLDQLFNMEHIELCDDIAFISYLEGIMQRPIPFAILTKLGHDQLNLSDAESRKLEDWIIELNSKPFFSDARMVNAFQKMIKRIVKRIPDLPSEIILDTFALVILRLHQKGCQFLMQSDVEWMQQRNEYIQNKLPHELQEQNVKLGKEINLEGSVTKVYEVTGPLDNEVVIVDTNLVNLHAKHQFSEILNQELAKMGLSVAKFIYIHPEGRFARVEKLRSCQGMLWRSAHRKMRDDEQKNCDAMLPTLKVLVEASSKVESAIPFALQHLQMDAKRALKVDFEALSTLKSERYFVPFNAVEDLIYSVANQNPIVFSYLATKSQLRSHRISQFYLEVVEGTLKNKQFDVKALYDQRTIRDPQALERAEELNRCVIVMQSDYTQQIDREAQEALKQSTSAATLRGPAPPSTPLPKLQRAGTMKLPPAPDQIMLNRYYEVGNSGLLAINSDATLRQQFVAAIVQQALHPLAKDDTSEPWSIFNLFTL